MRCRSEDEVKTAQMLDGVRQELEDRSLRLQRAISEGLIADDQPSALQALHQTVCRVDLLSEAVGKLNGRRTNQNKPPTLIAARSD